LISTHVHQFYLVIVLVTSIEFEGLGAVNHLITTTYIRLPSTKPAKFRRLPLSAVVLIATLTILGRAEGARQDSNKNNADSWDARAHHAHCDLDGRPLGDVLLVPGRVLCASERNQILETDDGDDCCTAMMVSICVGNIDSRELTMFPGKTSRQRQPSWTTRA
jgi:hypothetical protein